MLLHCLLGLPFSFYPDPLKWGGGTCSTVSSSLSPSHIPLPEAPCWTLPGQTWRSWGWATRQEKIRF
jgi:hypothetical protein